MSNEREFEDIRGRLTMEILKVETIGESHQGARYLGNVRHLNRRRSQFAIVHEHSHNAKTNA